MTRQVSTSDLDAAVSAYVQACRAVGMFTDIDPDTVTVARPYGQVWYLYRYDDTERPVHDLPGFRGSAGNGYVTRREIYDAVRLAARVLFDVADSTGGAAA